jgi:lysozyme
MKLSDAGLALIKDHEGLSLKAYRCPAGILTIGFGSTSHVSPGQVITEAEADMRLRADVAFAERAVSEAVQVPITQSQADALISFVFNVGSGAFKKSTLLRLLNQSRYAEAAAQFPRWNKARGRVLAGLTKRRAAERAMFEGKA